MIYRSYTETKVISSTYAASTPYSLRIPQSRRRLEAIFVEVRATTASAPSPQGDGLLGAIREIRLKVNDVLGQRNLIQAKGSHLALWSYNQTGHLDAHTMFAFMSSFASGVLRCVYPIWIRHPGVSEPIGNCLGLPLNQLNEDPILEVDTGPTTDMASANTPTITGIRAVLVFRDVEDGVVYVPSELVQTNWTLPGTGKQSFDLANGGFISSIQLDSWGTYGTTRARLFTAEDHELQLDLGPTAVRRYYPDLLDSIRGVQLGAIPQSTVQSPLTTPTIAPTLFTGGYMPVLAAGTPLPTTYGTIGPMNCNWMFDMLFDDSLGGAMSPGSLLNANQVAMGGDKVKITGTNFSATGVVSVLVHKFLVRDAAGLAPLIGA